MFHLTTSTIDKMNYSTDPPGLLSLLSTLDSELSSLVFQTDLCWWVSQLLNLNSVLILRLSIYELGSAAFGFAGHFLSLGKPFSKLG